MFFKSKKAKREADVAADLGSAAEQRPAPDVVENGAPAGAENGSGNQDAAQQRAIVAKSRFAALGEIVAVLMDAPSFKTMSLADVQRLVMPAILAGQYRVGQTSPDRTGVPVPVAVVLWASVSEELDRRLSQSQDFALKSNEWKSGGIPWLVAAAGDQRVLAQMLDHIQTTVLEGKKLKMRAKDSTGKISIGSLAKQVESGLPQHA
jgi:hemolysin-activating ACP:hemolysin acyltransferase